MAVFTSTERVHPGCAWPSSCQEASGPASLRRLGDRPVGRPRRVLVPAGVPETEDAPPGVTNKLMLSRRQRREGKPRVARLQGPGRERLGEPMCGQENFSPGEQLAGEQPARGGGSAIRRASRRRWNLSPGVIGGAALRRGSGRGTRGPVGAGPGLRSPEGLSLLCLSPAPGVPVACWGGVLAWDPQKDLSASSLSG